MMMEELDLLKKNWHKDTHLQNMFSEEDIYAMLQKKSSSVVKWIFYISLFEFGLGIVASFLLSLTKANDEGTTLLKKIGLYEFNLVLNVVIYSVVLFFIYRFYKMYSRINSEKNVKDLINSILKTRKVVKQYIAFNLTTLAIIIVFFGSYGISESYSTIASKNGELHSEMPIHLLLLGVLILILIATFITVIAWFIYKLLYGILLKRLNRNYDELKKLDF